MSKFASFVPERDKEDTLNAERLIKSLKKTYIIIGTIQTAGEDSPVMMVFPTLKDAEEWAEDVTGNFEIRSVKGIDYDAFELEDIDYDPVASYISRYMEKPRVANCCAETDMNGYTYTHALVSEKGIISCTECGQELEVKS